AAKAYAQLEDRLLLLGGDPGPPLTVGGQNIPAGGTTSVLRGYKNTGLVGEGIVRKGQLANIYDEIAVSMGILADANHGEQGDAFGLALSADLANLTNQRPIGSLDTIRERIESLLKRVIYRAPVLPARTAVLVSGAPGPGSDEPSVTAAQ